MRMRLAAATFLIIGAGSAAIGAAPINMLGSDTLNLITKDVINNCPGAQGPDGVVYLGTGSGNGETAMAANPATQLAAPMSRFLQAGPVGNLGPAKACDTDLGTGVRAEGLAFALDGVAIAGNANNANGCGGVAYNSSKSFPVTDRNTTAGVQCPGCDASNNYAAAEWGDFIRLAFFGIHHDAAKTRDCDSDARRSLVANYANLFQNACPSGTCAGKGIHRLWRRDDASGTTEVFAQLLGTAFSRFCNVGNAIPATTPVGFSDFLDKDPIRVPCDGNGAGAGEQVCGSAIDGNTGTLGLVLTIFPPDQKDVPVANLYPTALCASGEVELLPATRTTFTGVCPGGNPSFGGKCFASVIRTPGGPTPFNANCVQRFTTAGCPFLTPAGTDCRGANLWMRNPDGSLARDTSLSAAGRLYTGAFFRIHATRSQVLTSPACTKPTATEQIGCLVGDGDACSFGFAGRAAIDPPGTAVGLTVNNVAPDVASIQNLVTNPSAAYPLARKLYYNSIGGFGSGGSLNSTAQPELALAKCFVDDALMASASTTPANIIAANGYVQLPLQAGRATRSLCEDFKEHNATTLAQPNTGCGLGAGVNACADNASVGLPVN